MAPWAVGMGSARIVDLNRIGDKGRGHSSVRAPTKKEEEADASPAKEAPDSRVSEIREGIDTNCEPMVGVRVAEKLFARRSFVVGQWVTDGSNTGWLLFGQWKSRWFDYQPAARHDQQLMRS